MEKLQALTGESLSAIARALKLKEFDDRACAYIAGTHRKIYQEASGRYIHALLVHTVKNDNIGVAELGNASDPQEENPKPEEHGWYRVAFIELLKHKGIPCPDSLLLSGSDPGAAFSVRVSKLNAENWTLPYRAMGLVTVQEAAMIFSGVDPHDSMPVGDEANDSIRRFTRIIASAIDAGDLPRRNLSYVSEFQEIPHSDLRAWANKNDLSWPIPENSREQQPPDTAFLERYLKAANELEDLKAKYAEIEAENKRLQNSIVPIATPLLPMVIAVQEEFWVHWSESMPRPKLDVIVSWIRRTFPEAKNSAAIATAIEKVACPVNRGTGQAKPST